jgi:hypothetical protein
MCHITVHLASLCTVHVLYTPRAAPTKQPQHTPKAAPAVARRRTQGMLLCAAVMSGDFIPNCSYVQSSIVLELNSSDSDVVRLLPQWLVMFMLQMVIAVCTIAHGTVLTFHAHMQHTTVHYTRSVCSKPTAWL